MAAQSGFQVRILVNKFTRSLTALFVSASLLIGTAPAFAQTSANNLCSPEGTVIAYFNGVLTTELQAEEHLQNLRDIHGDTTPNGEKLKYEVLYNYSNGLDDFAETFHQRMLEQDGILADRFELFFDSLNGQSTWWNAITSVISTASSLLDSIREDIKATITSSLSNLIATPPTLANYQEQQLRLETYMLESLQVLIVAHSQGNLFANPAYDYLIAQGQPVNAISAVHIAPASPTVRGHHILADLDLVINGLRLAGGHVQPVTNDIPGYLQRPAGLNGEKDVLGHGLRAIYLNPNLDISRSVNNYIRAGLANLVAPPSTNNQGFFTSTLTWDGTGDVDMHIVEPDGTHIWYRQLVGHSGYLDYDNTVAFGPEHYYATCNKPELQVGKYTFALANYNRATGRTATLQIASNKDGVLGTRSAVMGPVTGDTPDAPLFTVQVSVDSLGKYSASVVD